LRQFRHPSIVARYNLLKPAEQNLSIYVPRLNPALFGRALERFVAQLVGGSHANLLEYNGARRGPDFIGLGPAAGRIFDITTYFGQASHYARAYGGSLELVLYEFPEGWPF
jgi:hypothetical protein